MTGSEPRADLAGFDACKTAEDYLEYFEVPYDARVVEVNRLHILRRFGDRISAIRADACAAGVELPAATLLALFREAMADSYRDFVRAGSLDHRVFKVLRDAAAGCAVAVDLPTRRNV
ncbi:MAG: nitrogenase-stabilizing/protective protein NifW [Actinomycetota bacterium]|nr:nitrogenase-stabilizing/protective protein NifW [Actinomycetota bacterium]